MRRLDIGIASYGKLTQLPKTVAAIQQHSVTDWRLFIMNNPHPKHDMRELICGLADRDKRIVPIFLKENIGYAGAVNGFLARAETEYMAYVDDDATVGIGGWDENLCKILDMHHEVGMVFPNQAPYMIDRGNYQECLWGVGFCWVMNRLCASDLRKEYSLLISLDLANKVGTFPGPVFDENLGHQEEADVCQRVRMTGWKCACIPSVYVKHEATATNNPASLERINRGVVRWVDKWNRYFNGKNFSYHSPNVTRFEDWPPNALYLEEYWQKLQPGLNNNPEVVSMIGENYDLIKVPRKSGFYRGRII